MISSFALRIAKHFHCREEYTTLEVKMARLALALILSLVVVELVIDSANANSNTTTQPATPAINATTMNPNMTTKANKIPSSGPTFHATSFAALVLFAAATFGVITQY